MGPRGRGNLLCLAMVAGGAALGAFVWLSWPEAETRLVRLPYGEAMPKHTRFLEREVGPVSVAAAPGQAPEPRAVRVVSAAEPEQAQEPEPAAVVAGATYAGPLPEPEDDGYVESAEDLGAEPLPGEQQDGAGEPTEAAPAEDEEAAEDEGGEPVLGVVIELPQPGEE